MAEERRTQAQDDAMREIARQAAEQEQDADIVAERLRLYAAQWYIPFLEFEVLKMAEDAVAARKLLESTQAAPVAGWVERKQGERRKGERRKGDRRKGDRRRTGLSSMLNSLSRLGSPDRRRWERRSGVERRQRARRHIVRRRSDR